MGLGEQIKQRRTELQMTQTDLADKLHVSRSAISNWEIGRNYPDMQIIVELSDLLNISLDTLLKGDTQMVAQISNDTKNVKRLHRKNTILLLIILLFLLFSILYLYKSHQYADITDPDQVVSVKLQKNNSAATHSRNVTTISGNVLPILRLIPMKYRYIANPRIHITILRISNCLLLLSL